MAPLTYLIREPKEANTPTQALFMLHGYGSNEMDLFSFADLLPPKLKVFSLRAPHLIMESMGYAWFPLRFDPNGQVTAENEASVLEATKQVANFIQEAIKEHDLDTSNISLLGFSQGCIMSYLVAILQPNLIKNVVGLSGYFKPELLSNIVDLKSPHLKQLNVFASHGTMDEVINVSMARNGKEALDVLGIPNVYKEYAAGHTISHENFEDLHAFLTSATTKCFR